MLANTFMRAPGESVGTFALECAIDELADELGIDPIELRRRNEPEKDPTLGHAVLVAPPRRGLPRGRRAVRLGRRDPHAARAARRRMADRAWACATATYPYYRMPGGAARITLTATGSADRSMAAATRWAWAPPPCRRRSPPSGSGLPLERGDASSTATPTCPARHAGRRLVSRRASIGAAVIAAQRRAGRRAAQARRQRLAARRARSRTRSEARDGGLCKRDEPERARELRLDPRARRARRGRRRGRGAAAARDAAHGRCTPTARSSARCASTRSPARRASRRFLGSFDCGRILNPQDRGAASSAAASSWASASR